MPDCLFFEITGEPVAKGRPRFTRFGRAYTPAKTKLYEERVKMAARMAVMAQRWEIVPVEYCVALKATFFMGMPKSWSEKKRASMFGRPCAKSPDLDNLEKGLCDGMNGAGVWVDDRQVARIEAAKFWHTEPAVWVSVARI